MCGAHTEGFYRQSLLFFWFFLTGCVFFILALPILECSYRCWVVVAWLLVAALLLFGGLLLGGRSVARDVSSLNGVIVTSSSGVRSTPTVGQAGEGRPAMPVK